MTEDYITHWLGKPVYYMTRAELTDALNCCVKELLKHNSDYHHQSVDHATALPTKADP